MECGMRDVECGMWNVECGVWNVGYGTPILIPRNLVLRDSRVLDHSYFFEFLRKCHKKPHLLGEIVSKMKKIYTTFCVLLALRSYTNYVNRLND